VRKLVIVSDASSVIAEVRAVVDDGETEIVELRSGALVRPAVLADPPDLVVTDCQIQSMGGIAIAMDLKLEQSGGRIPHVPVLLLLDRRADVFLARRAGAEGYLVKPLDPIRIRRAVEALVEGDTFYDESYTPLSIAAAD
jgi:DNA-binding NarL/FixJ family response regulator